MPSYVIVETRTGRIKNTIICPEAVFNANKDAIEEAWIAGTYDDKTMYFNGLEIAPRPTNPAVLDKTIPKPGEVVTLTGMPVPCDIIISGVKHEIVEPDIELTFPLAKVYLLTVCKFPYLDWEVDIHVAH